MKTWHILKTEPNSIYRATIFREIDSGIPNTPPSSINLNVELFTDSNGEVFKAKENPMIFGGVEEILGGFEVTTITNQSNGHSVDFRLFAAAMCGSTTLAAEALAEGVDPNLRAKQETSALHVASMKGHLDIMQMLLDAGGELNATDSLGWTPIFLAAYQEQHDAAAYLHSRGANPTATVNGKTSTLTFENVSDVSELNLLEAADRGDIATVQKALEQGQDINQTTSDGWTPLLASIKHDQVVKYLLAHGADPNIASDKGYTPLMRAAGLGRFELLKMLLASGANPAAKDCNGKTAYLLSMDMDEYDCANLVGDALAEKIIREHSDRARLERVDLQAIDHAKRMMIDMTRKSVGGVVRRLYFTFDDDSRLDALNLIEELVVEVPLEHVNKIVKAVGVPLDQG